MAQTYQAVISARSHEQVFAGVPTCSGPRSEGAAHRGDQDARHRPSRPSGQLRDAAFQAAPESEGSLNDTPCAWIADADPRLGPVLEAFVNGSYLWVPFARLRALRLEPPADLRDQVWMPAHFTWSNDREAFGFIPTRYPGSATASDPALALSHKTEWQDTGAEWSLPLGQRVLVTDVSEVALMDIRKIELTCLVWKGREGCAIAAGSTHRSCAHA
jgi:type VI secretion system protein ImpE